jgi:hypothetical protein
VDQHFAVQIIGCNLQSDLGTPPNAQNGNAQGANHEGEDSQLTSADKIKSMTFVELIYVQGKTYLEHFIISEDNIACNFTLLTHIWNINLK